MGFWGPSWVPITYNKCPPVIDQVDHDLDHLVRQIDQIDPDLDHLARQIDQRDHDLDHLDPKLP